MYKIFWAKKIRKNFAKSSHLAFTLVEVLIATIIIWLLSTVMFQVYITISNISVRIESEKLLQSETMFLVQNLQNLSDSQQIDLGKYDHNELKGNIWVVDKLYFTWGKYSQVFLSWTNCEVSKNCEIVIAYDENWDEKYISISDSKKAYFSNLKFKLSSYSWWVVSIEDSFQQGFSIFSQAYVSKYNPNFWPLNVKSDIQTFFSIR